MNYPVAGFTAVTEDDFTSGTVAAAFGGTTCIIDFSKTRPGGDVYETYARRIEDASQRAVIDYAVPRYRPAELRTTGIRCPDQAGRRRRGQLEVLHVLPGPRNRRRDHPHGFSALRQPRRDAIRARGERRHPDQRLCPTCTKQASLVYAPICKPIPAVAEDAADRPCYRVGLVKRSPPLHSPCLQLPERWNISPPPADRGQPVFGETCPQYLARSFEDYSKADDATAAGHICSPPIRERLHQQALWSALRDGDAIDCRLRPRLLLPRAGPQQSPPL